jgi:hypothetical protein
MAHVRSTARPHDDAPTQVGEGAAADRDVIDKGHNSTGSIERSRSVHAGDMGSQSNAKGDSDGGSCTHSCNFSPSTITVSRMREMIEQGYFAEAGARAPGEETLPEPENDEVIVLRIFYSWS